MVRPKGKDIPPNEVLNMSESLHLIIDYLLMNEWEDLEFKSHDWIGNMRG